MSIEIKKEQEFTTSRDYQGTPTAQTAQYLVHSVPTEAEAFELLKTTAPTYIGDLKLKTYEINEVQGGGAWTYDVNYEKSASGNPDNPTTQEPTYSFDTGSVSTKMISHLGEEWKSDGAESIDGIGWDGEKYNGVNIAKAQPTESFSYVIKRSKWTTKYKNTLVDMAFTINEKKFKGWEVNEVLFLGAKGNQTGDEDMLLTFNFSISRTKKKFKFMGIDITEKLGWLYLWAFSDKGKVKDKKLLPKATHAYIHKTYPVTDFKDLGIGT